MEKGSIRLPPEALLLSWAGPGHTVVPVCAGRLTLTKQRGTSESRRAEALCYTLMTLAVPTELNTASTPPRPTRRKTDRHMEDGSGTAAAKDKHLRQQGLHTHCGEGISSNFARNFDAMATIFYTSLFVSKDVETLEYEIR